VVLAELGLARGLVELSAQVAQVVLKEPEGAWKVIVEGWMVLVGPVEGWTVLVGPVEGWMVLVGPVEELMALTTEGHFQEK
jgi:hypothetical protein